MQAIRAPALADPAAAYTAAGSVVSALTLTALASTTTTTTTTTSTSSAAATRTGAMIELHNVTLVVPVLVFWRC